MRRAMSCEYWPPRSTTSTGRSSCPGNATTFAGSAAIVRRLLRDRHVVRVRLAQPRDRDPHERRTLHLLDRRRAAVAHRLPQAAYELLDDALQRALVRNPPLDTLGNELVDVLDVPLEVPVLGEPARLHRPERAHAAVLLEALALKEDHVARRLLRSGEHRSRHHGVCAGRDRLRDVAGRGEPAVGDKRDAVARGYLRAVVDRSYLRNSDTRDDARRTNRPRPDSRLQG